MAALAHTDGILKSILLDFRREAGTVQLLLICGLNRVPESNKNHRPTRRQTLVIETLVMGRLGHSRGGDTV